MTRINLVPPKELYDQHLIAEYREITMVPASLKRTLASARGFRWEMIPPRFTLNKGHVCFFYDKGYYLWRRYRSLCKEMRRRGFTPDPLRFFSYEDFPDDLFNDWRPQPADLALIRERIALRVSQRPGWYRKTG